MGYEKVDFKSLKAWMSVFKTVEDVERHRDKYLKEHTNLTQKQIDAITRIFSQRTDQIEAKNEGREYWDDKMAARQEGWIID